MQHQSPAPPVRSSVQAFPLTEGREAWTDAFLGLTAYIWSIITGSSSLTYAVQRYTVYWCWVLSRDYSFKSCLQQRRPLLVATLDVYTVSKYTLLKIQVSWLKQSSWGAKCQESFPKKNQNMHATKTTVVVSQNDSKLHSKIVLSKATQGFYFPYLPYVCWLLGQRWPLNYWSQIPACAGLPLQIRFSISMQASSLKKKKKNLSKKSPKCAFSSSGQDSCIVHATP